MVQIAGFIINEKLIKVAMPWYEMPKDGCVVTAYPPPKTKIIFTDNTELILNGLDCDCLYNELNKPL